jgi:hypothetical protein
MTTGGPLVPQPVTDFLRDFARELLLAILATAALSGAGYYYGLLKPRRARKKDAAKIRDGTSEGVRSKNYEYDVFICHASEDKDEIARPLAEALRKRGLTVWYDEFTLRLGDSLRRAIDNGLSNSRYGVVILSPSFFRKNWPEKELDGLVALEDIERRHKVILPIWHKVLRDDVLKYSPTLADKLAASTEEGLDAVVKAILEVVKTSEGMAQSQALALGHEDKPPSEMRSPLPRDQAGKTAATIPRIESAKARPVPRLHYEVTQTQSNGEKRELPSVGFNLKNLADYPVRIRVYAEVILDGKSLGYPSEWSGHYNGTRVWNLNPQGRTGAGIKDGNFTIPVNTVRNDQILMIRVVVRVVDEEFDSPLPVGWVYDNTKNDWYYEPAP